MHSPREDRQKKLITTRFNYVKYAGENWTLPDSQFFPIAKHHNFATHVKKDSSFCCWTIPSESNTQTLKSDLVVLFRDYWILVIFILDPIKVSLALTVTEKRQFRIFGKCTAISDNLETVIVG